MDSLIEYDEHNALIMSEESTGFTDKTDRTFGELKHLTLKMT